MSLTDADFGAMNSVGKLRKRARGNAGAIHNTTATRLTLSDDHWFIN